MKKKTLLVGIAILLFVLLLVIGIVLLITKPWETEQVGSGVAFEGIDVSEALLDVYNKHDIFAIEEYYGISSTLVEDEYFFKDIDCFGEKMTFTYSFDSSNYLVKATAYAMLEVTEKEIKEKCQNIINGFSSRFGVNNPTSYNIYGENSVFDSKDEASYVQIFKGKAILEFRVRETTDSFWVLKIQRINESDFLCTINHHVGAEMYSDAVANVDLT